jgi:hypothetical protein
MKVSEIARWRLHNQLITDPRLSEPGDVVRWLGAVQAQDYPAGLWAVGLRTRGATEADIEQAIAERSVVRTWPMRGTLHFVAPEDIRWMLKLLTPRIVAGLAPRHRELGLDAATFERSKALFVKALEGGKQIRRPDMYKVLEAGGISGAGQRFPHILGLLAQEGVLCFGAHEGKQPTFVLLDEWVPKSKVLERDEALAELARRYFTGHGPATLQDFVWWSGLKVADAKVGLEMAKSELVREEIGDKTYWLASSTPAPEVKSPHVRLLPVYDEYTVAYKDRSAALDPADAEATGNGIFSPIIVLDGRIVGTWGRTHKKDTVVIAAQFFRKLSGVEQDAFEEAAQVYGRFRGLKVTTS